MKRVFDVVLSLTLLLLLAPLLLAVAVAVYFNLGSPVFFRQQRPGLHGRPFTIIKFRTMSAERGSSGEDLADADRLGKFGNILRKLSLDELPELWNILVGDMSFVGPRPLLMQYLPLYNAFQRRRHEVRPGLTGWAQVNGRNNISWDEKFKLDVWYVDNQSFWLDLKIMLMTFKKLVLTDDVSKAGHATTDFFKGNG